MDKYPLSNHSKSNKNLENSHFRWDQTPTKDFNFSNELFTNLKKNYEERYQ